MFAKALPLKLILSLLVFVGLGACQSATGTSGNAYQVPESCKQQQVIDAFNASIPGSAFIPTAWQPAEGTNLKVFLDNLGIACTYGIESAEVGGTVMWVVDHHGLWEKQEEAWKSQNYRPIDIPNLDEKAAYLLPADATGVDDTYIWEVNLKIDNVWISLGGSFIQDISYATDIINAAIAVARR